MLEMPEITNEVIAENDETYFLPLTSPAPLERILQVLTFSLSAEVGISHTEREIRLIEAEAAANRACWERCRKIS